MAENTTHYGRNLDDFLWVLGFPLSMLNRHQRKTTLLDWHCSACSLFLKLSTVKKTTKRLTEGFNVLFNTDQRCWIFKTSLAFQLNDVSQFCRLFFCSQVCHPVQWCLYLIVPFWYALAAYQASLVEPDMLPKRTKKVRLDIYHTQIRRKTRRYFSVTVISQEFLSYSAWTVRRIVRQYSSLTPHLSFL